MLLNMAEVVMDQILGELDFLNVLTVRKVCHSLRDFIDKHCHPDPNLYSIQVTVEIGAINFIIRFANCKELSITYVQTTGGETSVQWKKKGMVRTRFLGNSDHLKIFIQDFGTFWRHQKGKLEKFHVKFYEGNDSEFMEAFQNILKTRNFGTHEFEIRMIDSNDMLQILPLLGPEKITIEGRDVKMEDVEMEEIMELEAWRNAKSLKIFGSSITVPVEKLLHFCTCVVNVRILSFTDVENVRKKFLLDSHMEYFKLQFELNSDASIGLVREFGQPLIFSARFRAVRKMWFFRTEAPNQVLVTRLYSRHVDFQRIEVSTIPPAAVILE